MGRRNQSRIRRLPGALMQRFRLPNTERPSCMGSRCEAALEAGHRSKWTTEWMSD